MEYINDSNIFGVILGTMMKNKMCLVGAICAHGERSIDNTYVVIKPEISFLTPLSAEGEKLKWPGQITNFDISVINTHEGRLLADKDFFDEKPYYPGYVLKNIDLTFCTTWPQMNLCYTTGIITTGKIHNQPLYMSNYKTNNTLKKELMFSNDSCIYKMDELWQKKKQLGDVLQKIIDVGKGGGYFGIFCRGPRPQHIEKIPDFMTISVTKELYYSNFFEKLESLEKCVVNRIFDEYSLINLKDSKLKKRVTCDEICIYIRKKLSFSSTISSFDFHSVIQIYHTHTIPRECVIFSLDQKLNNLIIQLKEFNSECIKTTFPLDDIKLLEFKNGLSFLCTIFRKNINIVLDKYSDTLDTVIFVCEKVISNVKIELNFYNKIIDRLKQFNINTKKDKGFAFVF